MGRRVVPGHQDRAHRAQAAEVGRNEEAGFVQVEDLAEGLAHSQVVGHPSLEGHRRGDGLALADVAFQIAAHGPAEAGDDLKVRVAPCCR